MGTVSLSVAYGTIFGNIVLLPLWLQQYMGYTATWAGLAMAPVGLLAIALSPWVGRNVERIDARWLASGAFVGFSAILWMRSLFNTQADFGTILLPTLLQGAAMALFFVPLQSIAFSGLPPERMPAAAGLNNFVRITAGAVGTSVFTTLWENRASLHHANLAQQINLSSPAALQALADLQRAGHSREQALAQVNRMIDQQAFTLAATDLFWMSSMLFVLLIMLVWLSSPTRHGAGPAAGGAH
jgi:DHA2 family multidrug resistance protein